MDASIVFKTNVQVAVKAAGSSKGLSAVKKLTAYVDKGGDVSGSLDILFPKLIMPIVFPDSPGIGSSPVTYPFKVVEATRELYNQLLSSDGMPSLTKEARPFLTQSLVDLCFQELQQCCSDATSPPPLKQLWKNVIHKLYKHCLWHREHIYNTMVAYCRHVGRVMVSKDSMNKSIRVMTQKGGNSDEINISGMFYCLSDVLEIFGAIISGFKVPLKASHVKEVFERAIMPLHANPLMLHELAAMICVYHKQLSFCVVSFVEKMPTQIAPVAVRLLCSYVTMLEQSPKSVVYLVSSLEEILLRMPEECFRDSVVFRSVQKLIVDSVGSLQFALAQRTLKLLKNPIIVSVLHNAWSAMTYQTLVPLLVKTGNSHWNDTTRQLCLSLLVALSKQDGSQVTGLREYRTLIAKHEKMVKREDDCLAAKYRKMTEKKEGLRYFDFVYVTRNMGEGSYSSVHKVRRIERGTEQRFWEDYAMKTMDKTLLFEQKYMEEAKREIRLLRGPLAKHPNIVNLISSFEDEKRMYMILEFAEHGDVFSVLEKLGTVSEDYARFIIAQTLLALEYVHLQGYVHLDLKPENLLVVRSGHVKLTDFGAAQPIGGTGDEDTALQGTAEYISPSLIKGNGPVPEDDIWALVMMLYQLLVGHTPFNHGTREELFQSIQKDDIVFEDGFPELAQDLITSIVESLRKNQTDPSASVEAIKAHAFFHDVDWENLNSTPAPLPAIGKKEVKQIDPNLRQRKFSMMLTNSLPQRYHFSTCVLDPIPEYDEGDDEDEDML